MILKGLVHDCSNSSALAMELLQSCTKPSIWASERNSPTTTPLFNRLFRLTTKNIKAWFYWPFVKGIHWPPVDSLHKGPVMWRAFQCHDVITIYCYVSPNTDTSPVFLWLFIKASVNTGLSTSSRKPNLQGRVSWRSFLLPKRPFWYHLNYPHKFHHNIQTKMSLFFKFHYNLPNKHIYWSKSA